MTSHTMLVISLTNYNYNKEKHKPRCSVVMTLTSKYEDAALVLNSTNVQAHSDLWISNLQGKNSQVCGLKKKTSIYSDAQPG